MSLQKIFKLSIDRRSQHGYIDNKLVAVVKALDECVAKSIFIESIPKRYIGDYDLNSIKIEQLEDTNNSILISSYKLIDELTEDQIEQAKVYRDKWIKIILSSDPIDFPKATDIMSKLYERAGLTPPETFVYCQSPIEALKKIKDLEINDLKQVRLPDIIRDKVGKSIEEKVDYLARQSMEKHISDFIYGSAARKVSDDIFDSLLKNDIVYYRNSTIYHDYSASVLAYYGFCREFLGLKKQTEKVVELIEFAKVGGECYCYENICFICDRPKLSLDENGQLHSESDYAFRYPDGFGDTYWHGQRIPHWFIFEKEKLTAEKILEENNKEVQRVMMDIYGREKLIKNEGELIHSDDWGKLYHLPRFKDFLGYPMAYLEVTNFSPNETAFLSKAEIDEIILKVQKIIGTNGMMRHGDVILVSKKAEVYSRELAEEKIKEYKRLVNQEINILLRRKQVSETVEYKKYFMRVDPKIKTAYEAWQSLHRKLNIDAFLPISAS